MFLDVDERHAETEMIGCQMSMSFQMSSFFLQWCE